MHFRRTAILIVAATALPGTGCRAVLNYPSALGPRYAGVAATNLNRCLLSAAELIDPASGSPLTNLDQRNADLVDEQAGYFWPPDIFQTPNIPACPDALHVGVVNRSAILRVDVQDIDGRTGRAEVRVTPVCGDDKSCACLCGPNPTHC